VRAGLDICVLPLKQIGNGRCVMTISSGVFATAAGLTVALALGGCAETDFWTTDPVAWLTTSQAQPGPTTTSDAQPAPNPARASAVQETARPNTASFWTTDPLTWLMGSQAEPEPTTTSQAEPAPAQARAKKVSAATNSNASVNSVRSKASVNSARSNGSVNSASSNASVSTVGSTRLVDEPNYLKIQDIGIKESDGN
jgi:hypothetical protein